MVLYTAVIYNLFNALSFLYNAFISSPQSHSDAAILPDVPTLWPLPSSLEHGSRAIKLANDFNFTLDFENPPHDLVAALARTLDYLKNDQLKPLVVGRSPEGEDAYKLHYASYLPAVVLRIEGGGGGALRSVSEEAVAPLTSRDEAYNMSIPSNGDVGSISAKSTLGLFRALTTFEQLWHWNEEREGEGDEEIGSAYSLHAPIEIHDEPAFVRSFASCAHVRLLECATF
jgi:hexosaminidase